MALQDVLSVIENIRGAVGLNAGNVGYYLAAAGLLILLVAGVFILGALMYRGLRSVSSMETGEFARFLVLSAVALLILGAIWP